MNEGSKGRRWVVRRMRRGGTTKKKGQDITLGKMGGVCRKTYAELDSGSESSWRGFDDTRPIDIFGLWWL